jgi:uncharacterized protein (DUF362 family)/Pyruvate/2-oxoacid:ferredoxin oxidoreductase delta subunit
MAISTVIIEEIRSDLREKIERIMDALAPKSMAGRSVLIKPNMVGPSAPELGHTTHPDIVRAVVQSCKDRGAKVIVGDNPGGISHNSRNVARITGILEAAGDCFKSLAEGVVEKKGAFSGLSLVVSRAVLEADYLINLPKFKTHLQMMISGAIKNTFGYIAGACKARLHLEAANRKHFAGVVCDIFSLRPPDLNIMDALTVIEGNGPCHGGHQRAAGKILASTDALALDSVMARMMGVSPEGLFIQKEAAARGLGNLAEEAIKIIGTLTPIKDFKMPVTYQRELMTDGDIQGLRELYPADMMNTRIGIKPLRDPEKCILCGECAANCPAGALKVEPEFIIDDTCIACFCCVELCTQGALGVPDNEAFRHY